ncbi:GM15167 [Drosophila sechellia]|uniref:GM15167 n=1 Tax=Drosophila sechellia TaxID=7238 RepID=B4IBT8_DROSE|nr:GM15167 [Drosophila sechellia]
MFRLGENFGNFYFENGLAYTEDRKVVRLVTISAKWHFSKSQLWKHFSSFGTVEDLQ